MYVYIHTYIYIYIGRLRGRVGALPGHDGLPARQPADVGAVPAVEVPAELRSPRL